MPNENPQNLSPWRYKQRTSPAYDLRTGYAVDVPNVGPTRNTANATVINQFQEYFDLWIEDVSTDFSLSGEEAQSVARKQFFPRFFNQPTIKIKGRMPNSYQYNRLAQFVRETQLYGLQTSKGQKMKNVFISSEDRSGGKGYVDPVVTLKIYRGGQEWKNSKTTKGPHVGWLLHGYIKSIKAGARIENHAPEFTFDFVIAYSRYKEGQVGIYEDERGRGSRLLPWLKLFKQWNMINGAAEREVVEDVGEAIDQVADTLDNVFGDSNPIEDLF